MIIIVMSQHFLKFLLCTSPTLEGHENLDEK